MTKYIFLDTETTALDVEQGEVWELAFIVRNPAEGFNDDEYAWQVRPSLFESDPQSLRIGRYYERAKMLGRKVGDGVRLATADSPTRASVPGFESNLNGGPAKEGDAICGMSGNSIAREVAVMLDGATIVGNNPRHDRDFLRSFLRNHEQAYTASHRMIDIRPLAMGYVCAVFQHSAVDEVFDGEAVKYVLDWLDGNAEYLDWRAFGVHQPEETRHTALGDARLVRDVFDAITGGMQR